MLVVTHLNAVLLPAEDMAQAKKEMRAQAR
jgi:hypothetical protein